MPVALGGWQRWFDRPIAVILIGARGGQTLAADVGGAFQ